MIKMADYQQCRSLLKLKTSDKIYSHALYNALLTELTDRQRQIALMYFVEQKLMREIATELQINPSTVSRTIHRAMQRIKKVLKYMSPVLLGADED